MDSDLDISESDTVSIINESISNMSIDRLYSLHSKEAEIRALEMVVFSNETDRET